MHVKSRVQFFSGGRTNQPHGGLNALTLIGSAILQLTARSAAMVIAGSIVDFNPVSFPRRYPGHPGYGYGCR